MLKLCLTGGPGSGKTVIFNHLAQILEERGYHVFLVPETEPELIMNGIRPNHFISNVAFQNFVMDKQLEKEKLYNNLVQFYPRNKIVIVYDRGLMDIATSVDQHIFSGMLRRRGLDVTDACKHYDAVLHLTTAADGAENFYQWNDPTHAISMSNLAMESPEEAMEKDKNTRDAWSVHKNLYVIDSSVHFSDKVKSVLRIVLQLLGSSEKISDIKRFIIRRPKESDLADLDCVFNANIIHTYLSSNNSRIDRSVVQRGTQEEGFTFYYIETVDMGANSEPFITEKQITMQEYENYLLDADHWIDPIIKFRQSFMIDKRFCEIDLYQFDNEYAVLEADCNIDLTKTAIPFEVVCEIDTISGLDTRRLAKEKRLPHVQHVQKEEPKAQMPGWMYETGREGIGTNRLNSGKFNVEVTSNEKRALKLFTENERTYLIRYREIDGIKYQQWYDIYSHAWVDS